MGPWEICECVQEERSSSSLGSRKRLALGKGPAWRGAEAPRSERAIGWMSPLDINSTTKSLDMIYKCTYPKKKHTFMLMTYGSKPCSHQNKSQFWQFWSFLQNLAAWVLIHKSLRLGHQARKGPLVIQAFAEKASSAPMSRTDIRLLGFSRKTPRMVFTKSLRWPPCTS